MIPLDRIALPNMPHLASPLSPDRVSNLLAAGRRTMGPGFPAWLATVREYRELLALGWGLVRYAGLSRLVPPNSVK